MAKLTSGSWDPPIDSFLFKVQNSPEFFNYYNVPEEEAMDLALQRARGYLVEAASRISFECSPDVDFMDIDADFGEFGFALTNEEVELLANLMFEMFIAKDIAKLRVHINLLTSQDLKNVYGVGYAERRSFMEMYDRLQQNNNVLIDRYASKDRLTGKRKTISFKG